MQISARIRLVSARTDRCNKPFSMPVPVQDLELINSLSKGHGGVYRQENTAAFLGRDMKSKHVSRRLPVERIIAAPLTFKSWYY